MEEIKEQKFSWRSEPQVQDGPGKGEEPLQKMKKDSKAPGASARTEGLIMSDPGKENETDETEAKEEKRRRIMEAAVDIFSGKLFHQVKMDEIASRAGVGKGTLYLYFQSKEELFRRSFQYAVDLYYLRLKEALEAVPSAREKLQKIVYLHVNLLQEQLKLIYLLVGQSMAPPMIFQAEVSRSRSKLLSLLEGIITKGMERGEFRPLDAGLAARAYLGGIVSFLHDSLHEGADIGDGTAFSETFSDLYLRGFNLHDEQKRGLK